MMHARLSVGFQGVWLFSASELWVFLCTTTGDCAFSETNRDRIGKLQLVLGTSGFTKDIRGSPALFSPPGTPGHGMS